MTIWLNSVDFNTIERGSPAKMESRFGGSFRYGNGKVNFFPGNDWQFRPDMSQVVDVPKKYWKMESHVRSVPVWAEVPVDDGQGGTVMEWQVSDQDVDTGRPIEMTQAEKDAVDAQELADRRESAASLFDRPEEVHRAFMLLVLDQINELRADHGRPPFTVAQMRNAIKNKLGG